MASGEIDVTEVESGCSNCNEIMTNPMSLDCRHSICHVCFEQLDESSQPNNKIECSKCKKCTDDSVKAKDILYSPRITTLDLRNIENFLDNGTIFTEKSHTVRFVNYENNLWGACPSDNCLNVYSHDLNLIKSVPCPDVKLPRTLHPLTSQLMLVGGENGLFEISSESGKVENKLLSGEIWDVHVNQGLIAVAVSKTERTQVLWRSSPYNIVFHPGTTVLITPDEKIFVSNWNNSISEYSKQGVFINHHGRYGTSRPHELYFPNLCLADTMGNILVADSWNHRLQVRTEDGNWFVPQQRGERIYYPRDVCVTDTHLYLTDEKGIHKFSLFPNFK